jgi:NitT/TauT family transport system permease protein
MVAVSSEARSFLGTKAGDRWLSVLGVMAAVAGGFVIWYGIGALVPRFPVVHEVAVSGWGLLYTSSTYVDLWATLRRVMIGFLGATVIGIPIGTLMGASPTWRGLLKPWTIGALSIPGPVAIITAILILGIGESSALVALIVSVLPYVSNIIMDSVGGLDHTLDDAARVFKIPRRDKWRHVVAPQLLPGLFASVRTAFALSWKLVVVIEALGTSRGVGSQMQRSFRVLDVAQGIAWAALFTMIMWGVEVLVFKRIESHLFRWRAEVRAI